MSSGLGSPRVEFGPKKSSAEIKEEDDRKPSDERSRAKDGWGYFDVVPEGVEA